MMIHNTSPGASRRGAVIPLFAVLLPAILILCGVAINIAYMQLTRTELKIASDAAARAAGRGLSEFQDVDAAIALAQSTAALNEVAGQPLTLDDDQVTFGLATRTNGGYGRYSFTPKNTNAVRNKTDKATAVRIFARRDNGSNEGAVRLLIAGVGPFNDFQPTNAAISTQVDRDIALILDRSGSMAESTIDWSQHYSYEWVWSGRRWRQVVVWDDPDMEDAYNDWYDGYVDWYYGGDGAPPNSRWEELTIDVNAFVDVLDNTDQEELVSVATFSTSASLDLQLTSTYDVIRDLVADTTPGGATAIGQGMNTGLPTLMSNFARPYAAKTIVILTDGINNQNPDPVSVAQTILADNNVTIHTVTFSDGANQEDMAEVASIGGGRHYHADSTDELVEIFEEIANNLPTILTQ